MQIIFYIAIPISDYNFYYSCQSVPHNYILGILIGFEMASFTTTEGTDPSVEICAVVVNGTLERDAIVIFSTTNDTATGLSTLQNHIILKLYGDQDGHGETSGCSCSCPLTGDLLSSACICGCVVDGVSATAAT